MDLPRTERELPGTAHIRRHIDNDGRLLAAFGDFHELAAAWARHVALWEAPHDDFSTSLMVDGLAVAALHLSSRLKNETIAWTLRLAAPARSLFLTGNSGDGTITGRVLAHDPTSEMASRLAVQVIKARGEPYLSVTEVHGSDLLAIFEEFYARSEQLPARFYRFPDAQYLAIHALPGADRTAIAALTAGGAMRVLSAAPLLEERMFRFECGCTLEKIRKTMLAVFRENPEELFEGEERVEVFCPRCGRRWWVGRDIF